MSATMNIKDVPTCDLVKELRLRQGVKAIDAEPYEPYSINGEGPAVVLIVED